MLQIRSEQFQVLEEHTDRRFGARICDYLLDTYPETCEDLDQTAFEDRVYRAIRTAKTFGLSAERSIAEFVTLTFCIGPNFYEHPAARAILEDPTFEPDCRIGHVSVLLTPEQRAEAATCSCADIPLRRAAHA